jgi:GNAT superfamily N-acetyltransferase
MSPASPPKTGELYIEPVTRDEAHLYQAIRHETFRPTINKILYAREPSQETQVKIIQKTKEDMADGTMFMACKERATGKMIAGARWRFVYAKADKEEIEKERVEGKHQDESPGMPPRKYRERTLEEVHAGLTIPSFYPESNVPAVKTLFGLFNQHKLELLGTRPYMVLDTLVTHPDHHRRGAGGMLVEWGCREADKRGVEAYLEASVMGAPLYERFGFKKVRTVQVDLKQFGGYEVLDFIVSAKIFPSAWGACG